jgi:glycerophosphoryl diester phosphodiesterase
LILNNLKGAKMLWISHRGESYDAPENTMAAFNLAWERDSDGVECDIRLTADGEVVCIHDADTGRVADKTLTVADSAFAELRELDFGSWKDSKYAGEKIPALSELLASVPDGKIVLIEIKTGTEILQPMKSVIEASGLKTEQVVIICFTDEVLGECKQLLPQYKTALLVSFEEDEETGNIKVSSEQLIERITAINSDGVDSHCNEKLTRDFVKTVQEAGLDFHVWTIDDLEKARRFKKLGLNSITSNRAKYLMDELNT